MMAMQRKWPRLCRFALWHWQHPRLFCRACSRHPPQAMVRTINKVGAEVDKEHALAAQMRQAQMSLDVFMRLDSTGSSTDALLSAGVQGPLRLRPFLFSLSQNRFIHADGADFAQ